MIITTNSFVFNNSHHVFVVPIWCPWLPTKLKHLLYFFKTKINQHIIGINIVLCGSQNCFNIIFWNLCFFIPISRCDFVSIMLMVLMQSFHSACLIDVSPVVSRVCVRALYFPTRSMVSDYKCQRAIWLIIWKCTLEDHTLQMINKSKTVVKLCCTERSRHEERSSLKWNQASGFQSGSHKIN